MKEKNLICTYSSDFVLGGIESYYMRMFRWANANGYRTALVIPFGKSVHDAWRAELKCIHTSVGYDNNRYFAPRIMFEDGNEIEFTSEFEGVVIAADIFSYIRMLRLKSRYNMQNLKLILYIFLPTFCRASKKRLVNLPIMSLMKRLLRSGMVFMDEDTLYYCNDFYNCNNTNEKIVRLGLEIPDINIQKDFMRQDTRKRKFTILSICRMDFPFKSYILGLVDAYVELKKCNEQLELVIIGDGEDIGILESKIKKMPKIFQEDIQLLGSVSYDTLKKYFNESDVYVGMGTTLLDAAIQGIPGIISKAFCEEALTTGFFCEAYNDLSGNEKVNGAKLMKIEEVLRKTIDCSFDEYKQLCSRSYDMVKEYYNINKSMRQLLEVKDDVKLNRLQEMTIFYYSKILKKVQELGIG